MASKILMEAPVCLIDNNADAQLCVNSHALKILKSINQPVVVVSIVGFYRTGKSYLMNKLAGHTKGFALGSTIQSHTKGIWMWCVPHPQKPNHTLVLLDTEGLGDVEKGDDKNDTWIFSLAVLLSSTFVYNSMGTINQQALEQLQFVSELTDHIKVKSNGPHEEEDGMEDEGQFARFFPNFVWVVRDFTLELKIDGHNVTEEEYLEHALALKKGCSKKVKDYNLPRECIQTFFPTRNCFVFVRPALGNDMNHIESLPNSALDPQFIQQTEKFCKYVFDNTKVKTVKGGYAINGRMFGSLVESYVETMLSGAVPCLENAVLSMATIENEAAVKEAAVHYTSMMEDLARFPVEVQQLSHLHGNCEGEALKIFMKHSFKDEGGKYQEKFMTKVSEYYGSMLKKNEDVSIKICSALFEDLSAALEKNRTDGLYFQPGGYEMYSRDRNQVVNQFLISPNKGVKAQEALDKFLVSKKGEAEAILRADKNLTEAQKKCAEEKEKAALSAQEKKAAEEKNLQMEQLIKDQERSNQENMRHLEAKMAKEAKSLKKEADRALESKLKLQSDMLKKGFKEKAKMMQEDISKLRREADNALKMNSHLGYTGTALDVAKVGLSAMDLYRKYNKK